MQKKIIIFSENNEYKYKFIINDIDKITMEKTKSLKKDKQLSKCK